MTLRASEEGVVPKRDVVRGNYYDSLETLLVIARDDELPTLTGNLGLPATPARFESAESWVHFRRLTALS